MAFPDPDHIKGVFLCKRRLQYKISISSLVLQTRLSYHSKVSTSEQDIKNDIRMLPTQTDTLVRKVLKESEKQDIF